MSRRPSTSALVAVAAAAVVVAAGTAAVGGCGLAAVVRSGETPAGGPPRGRVPTPADGWVYQLQGYPAGGLDELARAVQPLVVIDLARDANADFFTRQEIAALRSAGKTVLAYFEIGSIETFRPEYPPLRARNPSLILNVWPQWPDEYFVRYWEPLWWEQVVRPRIDQALAAGFDGAYLDTPLAYEELDLSLVGGRDRDGLARAMVNLITRISTYAKQLRPWFLIVPQNSPELRAHPGYLQAIDGIGLEELFIEATDRSCTEAYCAQNLAHARALQDAGKFVLAVDYATVPQTVHTACSRYRREGFIGYVGVRELDRAGPACDQYITSAR